MAKIEITFRFNSALQALVAHLARRLPGDAKAEAVRSRVVFAVANLPSQPIEMVGPHLLKYSDQIYDDDAAFFTRADFAMAATGGKPNDYAQHFIPALQRVWAGAGAEERAGYLEAVRTLHDLYLDYLDAR